MTTETERIRYIYDRAAQKYDRSESWERRIYGPNARAIVREAHGETLEIAVGTGRNFALYPRDVRLTGIELSDEMLEQSRARAAELAFDANLLQGDAQQLPFPDASFDTVVCTFALCTIPDDRKAVAEAHRVLRTGGALLLVEHVRSPNPLIRLFERIGDPIMHRIAGDHLLRDPLDYLTKSGFELERVERSRWGLLETVRARSA